MLLEIEIQTPSKSMFFLIWLILYFPFFIIYISFTINFNGSICGWTAVLQDMQTLLSCFTYINSAFICRKTWKCHLPSKLKLYEWNGRGIMIQKRKGNLTNSRPIPLEALCTLESESGNPTFPYQKSKQNWQGKVSFPASHYKPCLNMSIGTDKNCGACVRTIEAVGNVQWKRILYIWLLIKFTAYFKQRDMVYIFRFIF